MPSRAFCSDESQGAALLHMTKHFGIFPFNHGLVGGIVAVEWHTPHAIGDFIGDFILCFLCNCHVKRLYSNRNINNIRPPKADDREYTEI